jgi:hypothetical protein
VNSCGVKHSSKAPIRFHGLDGSLGSLAQQCLELGKDQLYRIEVWAVGRQEENSFAPAAHIWVLRFWKKDSKTFIHSS